MLPKPKLKLRALSSLSILALSLLFSACSSGGAPRVSVFSSDDATITAGEQTRLYWQGVGVDSEAVKAVFNTNNTLSMNIEPGVGDVTGQDFVMVSPTQTTTYTLTLQNSKGQSSYDTTVTVTPTEQPGPGNNAPVASAQEVSLGDGPVTLTLTGSAADGDTLSFAIVTQPSKGVLSAIDQTTGKVTYTPNPNASGQDSFTFTVSNGKTTSAPATVLLNLGVVGNPPKDLSLSGSKVDENQPAGTVVGTFSTSASGTTFSYSLVSGEGDTDNASFEIQGNKLVTKASFDFETKSSYSVRVQVSDGNGGSFVKTFVITVNDLNESGPQDTTAPTVTITAPGPLTVDEAVTLSGTANDNVGVVKVEIYEGSSLLGLATLSNGTWNYSYTPAAAGTFNLRAVAVDAAGNKAEANTSASVVAAKWPVQFGTTSYDEPSGVATDASGNVYVTGYTGGDLGDPENMKEDDDAFLAKYDSSGNQIWVRQFGTASSDYGYSITTDTSGNVYVSGLTTGAFAGYSAAGGDDVFITKYDSEGNQLWLKQFGSNQREDTYGLATDASGNVYMSGYTNGALPGNTNAGGRDLFLVKFDGGGNQIWLKQFGTDANDSGYDVAIDASGNVYMMGITSGTFPGNTSAGRKDTFLTKFDGNGNQIWVRQFGSIYNDDGQGIATDASGNVYIAGYTNGTLPGNTNGTYEDAFLAKYDSSGNQIWLKQFGNEDYDEAYDVATDASGNIYVTGYTDEEFPGNTSVGSDDAFLAKYDSNGNQVWVRQFGTDTWDYGYAVATDTRGNIYVTGYTYGIFSGQTGFGDEDGFIVKYNSKGEAR